MHAEVGEVDKGGDDTAHAGGLSNHPDLNKSSMLASVTGGGGTSEFLHAVEDKRALKVN